MVTKNFFYWLSLVSLLFTFVGCETFRNNVRTSHEPETIEQEQTKNPIDPETNQPVIKDPSFTSASAPKLGVILGGGGVLTYAEIGLLHELTKQKINVHAIVGIEWGALVAGIFSKTNSAHEVEWQLLKLPHDKFIQKGVFGSSKGAVSVDKFNDFISTAFSNKRIESAKVPFACPFMNIKKNKSLLSTKGYYKNVLKACWPHPPQFEVNDVAADLQAAELAVTFLRNQGAELILYVDVMGNNVLLPLEQRKSNPQAAMLWLQAQNYSAQLRRLGVNEVLSLPLSGAHTSSYDSMRMMVRMGQLKSQGFIQQFAKKYGY